VTEGPLNLSVINVGNPDSEDLALLKLSNRTEVPIVALVRRFVREGLAKQPPA